MPTTHIMLGGVPIVLHAGAPVLSEEAIGGSAVLRMSDGAGVKSQHWERMAGSITGSGWIPPGLDGLDYSQPLELRSTQVNAMHGDGPEFTLTGTPRPDVLPWADALVGDQWKRVPSSFADGVLTVTTLQGASLYRACWLPVYSVFASRPPKTQSTSHDWSISWEET